MTEEKTFTDNLLEVVQGLRTGERTFEDLNNFIYSLPLPVKTEQPTYDYTLKDVLEGMDPFERRYVKLI